MNTEESGPSEDCAPEPEAHLIDFERAEIITPMIYPPQPRLVVSGTKPDSTMEITLVPLVYVSTPPYWGIQVVGTAEAGPHVTPAIALPYSVEIDLAGITGTNGIEVIGAASTEQLTVTSQAAT